MPLAARPGRHVADDDVERSSERLGIGCEGVECANLRVRGQRGFMLVQIDPEDASTRPDALRGVQSPGPRACSQVEDALPLFEQTEPSIDLLQLVDRACGIAFTPRPAPVAILLPPGGQLALVGRRSFFGCGRLFFDWRIRKRHGGLLDCSLDGYEPVACARDAAIHEYDVLLG